MAAVTVTWDPTAPAGSSALNAGDDAIRVFKTGLVERLRNGGHQMQTAGATTDASDGRHCCGESNAAGSAELTGEFTIYAADTSTAVAVFRDSTAATPSELFMGANGIRTTGTLKAATVNATSIIRPDTDTAVDLGINTTNRFRDLWLGRNATIVGTLAVTGVATFTAVPVFSAGASFTTLTVSSQLFISGGQRSGLTNVSSGPATLTTSNRIILLDPTAGSFTVNLPSATLSGLEYWLIIVAAAAGSGNTVTVDGNAAETIDGSATVTMKRGGGVAGFNYSIHIISDGSNWQILHNRVWLVT